MLYTYQQIINIEKVSQYLCANDIQKGGLNGGGIDLLLPRKLYIVRKSIEWLFGLSPNDISLTQTSNYLLALCAPYSFKAAYISGSSSGGSISPTGVNSYSYVALPFTITADSTSFFNEQLVGGKDLGLITVDNQVFTLAANNYTYNGAPGVIVDGTINFINGTQLFAGSTITFYFNKKY